jgi:hypothetical protein
MPQPRAIHRTKLHPQPPTGSPPSLSGGQLQGQMLNYVDGKKVIFENCNFSAAVLYRGYFHDAVFRKCEFVGTRFDECNFRQATFDRCTFDYADFNRCILPIPQILANLPVHSNVRWDLIHNIRANQRTMGDVQHEADLVRKDIEAEIAHWKDVRRRPTSYYNKYDNLHDQAIAWFHCRRLWVERYIWGHGESLTRLFFAALISLFILTLVRWIPELRPDQSLSQATGNYVNGLKYIAMLFIDLPVSSDDVDKSPTVSSLVVVVRYVVLGLAIPTLYKKIAKR